MTQRLIDAADRALAVLERLSAIVRLDESMVAELRLALAAEPPDQSRVTPDTLLSNGLVVVHRRMANGAQEAIAVRGNGALTPEEWREYCDQMASGQVPQ